MVEGSIYYVDSSVVLRAIVEGSPAARTWFDTAQSDGSRFVASRLAELEVRRVLKNAGLDDAIAAEYLDEFVLVTLTDDLIDDAIDIDARLGGADSLHLATALRIGAEGTTIVTHDKQMATGAIALGFEVTDPVSDDPGRPPVVP